MKRILSIILCIAMIFSFASFAAYAEDSSFTDVNQSSWYYDDVMNAVRLGIINGKSPTTFAPEDNLTYAEAIKLAACMHQLYEDGSVYLVSTTNPWYETYVEYCKKEGIISKDYNYDTYATRAGYMEIFANALPDEALPIINQVPDDSIPDVPSSKNYAPAIYKLYRAGILMGVDAEHNCNPISTIKRCEVAAIITRMMNENERVEFGMGMPVTPPATETETENTDSNTSDANKTETPKTDSDASDSLILAIPKEDIILVPDIKEEIMVPVKIEETPEMYEPLTITQEPEYIASANEDEMLQYTVKAEGGKAPYTYSWVTRSNKNLKGKISDNDYVAGSNRATLAVLYNANNTLSDSQFACVVTDALGQSVTSNFVTMPEPAFIFHPEGLTKISRGHIFSGRVEKGSLKVGETIAIYMPSEDIYARGVVSGIEMFKKALDEATAGDYCGILIEKLENIPYDSYVSESLGKSVTEYIGNMDAYAVKVPLKTTVNLNSVEKLGETTKIFVATSGGTAPYTYEWYMRENGGDYKPLAGNPKYTVNGNEIVFTVDKEEFSNNTYYKCVITDAAGNTRVESGVCLHSKTYPYICQMPVSTYANYGDEVTFKVRTRAKDVTKVTYQWFIRNDETSGWAKIIPADTWASGENTSELTIQVDKSTFISHCEYRCEITYNGNTVISDPVKILPQNLIITKQPENTVGSHGSKVRFIVEAEGANEPFTYQWLISGPEFEFPVHIVEGYTWALGEDTYALVVSIDEKFFKSEYTFSCMITDSKGNRVVSKEARVILTSDPNVTFEENSSEPEMIVLMD